MDCLVAAKQKTRRDSRGTCPFSASAIVSCGEGKKEQQQKDKVLYTYSTGLVRWRLIGKRITSHWLCLVPPLG